MKPLSTPEVAKAVGIDRVTLERWLARGKVPGPKVLRIGRRIVRLWGRADVERVRRYKAKFYRKGRGRRKRRGKC